MQLEWSKQVVCMQNTLSKIVEFTLLNKKDYSFYEWDDENIIRAIFDAYTTCRLLYSSDGSGITGICIFDPRGSSVHICQMLSTSKEAFRCLVAGLSFLFSAQDFHSITFFRRKKQVKYSNKRMQSLILKGEVR